MRRLAPLAARSVATASVAAACLGVLVWTALPATAAPPSGGGSGLSLGDHGEQVSARLFADVSAVGPGNRFQVGIEITMASGWHTYWENGGDAGLPTSVEWTLPDGFTAGPIRWPVPHRYAEDGDVVTFGYADRTVLLVDITAPSPLPEGPLRFDAVVDWLQCKDICIPGSAELDLVLTAADARVPAPDPVLRKFETARKQLAQAISSRPDIGIQAFQDHDAFPVGSTGEVAVVFAGLGDVSPEDCEFFPRPTYELWMRDGTFRSDGENLALIIPVEVDTEVAAGSVVTLPAVVRIPRNGEELLLSFNVPVTVAEDGAAAVPTGAPVFRAGAGSFLGAAGNGAAAGAASGADKPGLLRNLLLAFLGGIILNVMPCVLPVVSLKIMGFVSKAEEDPAKIARLGWTFAAGVIASFMVLAGFVIGLKAAGEQIGWGFQFQNPVFVGALAVVVFVFSLNLLGVFEMRALARAPGWRVIQHAAKDRADYADAFFHGILTTILATPCTAPMLGAAIAFAFAQPGPIIALIFFTVALGLATPYVLLCLNPGWLKYLPKPGMWMERFKQGMGFLLLATLVWLLFVFGAQTSADGLTWMLAFLLVIGFFAWMHGTFLNMVSSPARVLLIWALTIAGVGWSYKAFLHDQLFSPAEAYAAVANGTASFGEKVEVTKGGVRWEPFSTEYLEASVADGRTVFIDFTADWCWTCKVNEKTVLADDDVERLFHENRVLTLKGDWTKKDPEITEILRLHERAGVPFYAVYPAGRPQEVIVLPEIINKKLVLESLMKAGPSRLDSEA